MESGLIVIIATSFLIAVIFYLKDIIKDKKE